MKRRKFLTTLSAFAAGTLLSLDSAIAKVAEVTAKVTWVRVHPYEVVTNDNGFMAYPNPEYEKARAGAEGYVSEEMMWVNPDHPHQKLFLQPIIYRLEE